MPEQPEHEEARRRGPWRAEGDLVCTEAVDESGGHLLIARCESDGDAAFIVDLRAALAKAEQRAAEMEAIRTAEHESIALWHGPEALQGLERVAEKARRRFSDLPSSH